MKTKTIIQGLLISSLYNNLAVAQTSKTFSGIENSDNFNIHHEQIFAHSTLTQVNASVNSVINLLSEISEMNDEITDLIIAKEMHEAKNLNDMACQKLEQAEIMLRQAYLLVSNLNTIPDFLIENLASLDLIIENEHQLLYV